MGYSELSLLNYKPTTIDHLTLKNGAYGSLRWGLALLLALLLLCVSYFLSPVLPPFREGLKDRSFVLRNLFLVAVFFVHLGIAGGCQRLLL